MSEDLLLRLQQADKARELHNTVDCRPEVLTMHQHYVQGKLISQVLHSLESEFKFWLFVGQIEIVKSILTFTEAREKELMKKAEELGIQFYEGEERYSDAEE